MLLLLNNAAKTKEAAGLLTPAHVEQLPPTACPLSQFLSDTNSPSFTIEYKTRLSSVARLLGHLHSNVDLRDPHPRYLKSINFEGARGRYIELENTNLGEHQKWLHSHGVELRIESVYSRAETLGSIMTSRKYKSHYSVCVPNLYPDAILVDEVDPNKVYCLAEDGRESPLETTDRLYPLARFAFTSKLPKDDLETILFQPYITAYESNPDIKDKAFDYERFFLLLHAIHLDYYLYWTKFRNPISCKRIQDRLLAEDARFDSSFFGPDKFKKLQLYQEDSNNKNSSSNNNNNDNINTNTN